MSPREAEAALWVARLAAVREALALVTAGRTAKETATRAELLAWLVKASPCKTQKEVAAQLGLTPGRVCQMLRVLNRSYSKLG